MQKSLWKERLTSQLAHLVMGRKLTTEGNDCLVKILTQYFHFLQILKCEWKASKDLKSTLHSKHVDPLYYIRKLAWTLDWPVLKYCGCVPIRWFWLQSCIIITCTYSVILWPSMMEGWSFSNLFLKSFFYWLRMCTYLTSMKYTKKCTISSALKLHNTQVPSAEKGPQVCCLQKLIQDDNAISVILTIGGSRGHEGRDTPPPPLVQCFSFSCSFSAKIMPNKNAFQ